MTDGTMSGKATALMLDSLLRRNWLVDESWVVFMGDGSWEEDVPFPIPGAHDVDPLKKNLDIAQNTYPISIFSSQTA